MKKNILVKLVMSLLILFATVLIPISAEESMIETDNVRTLLYKENNQSISYNNLTNKYELENVTLAEFSEACEKADWNIFRASNEAEYTTYTTIPGYAGGSVRINYSVNMNIDTITYNGTEYVQFVSVDQFSYWIPSSSYDFDTGTSEPSRNVISGGSRLKITQYIQLVTTRAVTVSGGLSAGWVSTSVSGTDTYYLRSPSLLRTTYITLPLYHIMF